jgi:hypothetical protein
MTSSDAFSDLHKQELHSLRVRFGHAYAALWRLERMFRYVYWLEHRDKPQFNLTGSWKQADLQAEMELWTSFVSQQLDTVDVIDAVTALLEDRFGQTVGNATVRASDMELASQGLPVWNEATGSLVPQTLGSWQIYSAQDNERQVPGMGITYHYRHPTVDAPLTLYVFNNCLDHILPGISDPRIANVFSQSLHDIETFANLQGSKIEWLTDPLVETLRSRRESEISLVATTWNIAPKDGARTTSALSITGFCGHLLKFRMTAAEAYFEHDDGLAEVCELNLDVADFMEFFGP